MKIKSTFAIVMIAITVTALSEYAMAGSASVRTATNTQNYTCYGVSEVLDASSDILDTSIPGGANCAVQGQIEYFAKNSGGGAAGLPHYIVYCSICDEDAGYVEQLVTETSTKVPACKVIYTTCVKSLVITKSCEGLPCENKQNWAAHTTSTQTRCNDVSNTCEYRCADGYYQSMAAQGSLPPTCTACPDNGVCTADYGLKCNKGFYREQTIGRGTQYICSRCPSSGGVYGTTASTGATAITQCYLPSGTEFSDDTGSGTYTGNCYYSL